jgi:hypothetical protein
MIRKVFSSFALGKGGGEGKKKVKETTLTWRERTADRREECALDGAKGQGREGQALGYPIRASRNYRARQDGGSRESMRDRPSLAAHDGPRTSLCHGLTHTTTNRTAGKAGGGLGHP